MTFVNQTRNSTSFTNQAKSDVTTFGALTNDQIGTLSNDSIFQGKAVGDWKNDDVLTSTVFVNTTRNV